MNPLQHYLKNFKGTVRWTRAHLEKRKSMSANWSRDDCLNQVAAKVAIGKVNFDIDCQYKLIELQEEDIMKNLIQSNSWSLQMKDGSTPILADIQQQIDNWRLVTYLQKRVGYRAKLAIPKPLRWTDTAQH